MTTPNKSVEPTNFAFKLLGIYFDENLTFNFHFEIIAKPFCIKDQHFVNIKSFITIYSELIHSYLSYLPLSYISCSSGST
jgi:hypothetical protein